MDNELQRELLKQLKFINRLIKFMLFIFFVTLVLVGYIVFRVITFVQDTTAKLDSAQQQASDSLNVRQQACESDSIGDTLRSRSDFCN